MSSGGRSGNRRGAGAARPVLSTASAKRANPTRGAPQAPPPAAAGKEDMMNEDVSPDEIIPAAAEEEAALLLHHHAEALAWTCPVLPADLTAGGPLTAGTAPPPSPPRALPLSMPLPPGHKDDLVELEHQRTPTVQPPPPGAHKKGELVDAELGQQQQRPATVVQAPPMQRPSAAARGRAGGRLWGVIEGVAIGVCFFVQVAILFLLLVALVRRVLAQRV